MALEALQTGKKVIGAKQTIRAVEKDLAAVVYVAADADRRVVAPLLELCEQRGVLVEASFDMADLGKACMIEVGAAAVALLKSC